MCIALLSVATGGESGLSYYGVLGWQLAGLELPGRVAPSRTIPAPWVLISVQSLRSSRVREST
jgi:hypothetical protein